MYRTGGIPINEDHIHLAKLSLGIYSTCSSIGWSLALALVSVIGHWSLVIGYWSLVLVLIMDYRSWSLAFVIGLLYGLGLGLGLGH
jgi:hypothetical protein